MFFKIYFVVVLLVSSSVRFASSQTCGTADSCSTDYSEGCPKDQSAALTCMQSQASCNEPLVSPVNTSVQCYSSCIVGAPFDPSVPLQCCADPILDEPLSQTANRSYLVARMYTPNSPGQGFYRPNTVCNYNIQCPSNFDLHYILVRYEIEAPSNSGDCLDFLRFHFTATGANVDADVCGNATSHLAPDFVRSGFHGSSLSLEFRSNRILTDSGFFVAAVCINPAPFRVARQVDVGFQQRSDCQPSFLPPGYRVIGKKKRSLEQLDPEEVFPIRGKRSFRTPWVRVNTSSVLKYENNVLYVEEHGKVVHRFERLRVLQVYNKIEGYLTFHGSSSPPGRTFPGYGKVHIGKGIAYYIQTIVDPRFLLSEEEDVIVNELLGELFRRQAFSSEQFYFTPPSTIPNPEINCTVNYLAELNRRSCTAVVRSTVDFFLRTDPFLANCQRSG